MDLKNLIFALFSLLLSGPSGSSQNCSCTIAEVENNRVAPCNLVIGTIDTVFTTSELKEAINAANSTGGNRTILIADGTYPIASTSWYPYITASNVVFRSLSGNRNEVLLTGTGMRSVAPQVENGFYIVGNHVTIADLTIKDVGNHGIACEGDHLLVHNVKIQDTYEQMIKGTAAGDGADSGMVQCSLMEYTAGVGPNFYIGGLDIHKGNDWAVHDNILRYIASPAGTVAEHAIHFWNFSANNIIERNWILNCDRGIGFGLGSSPNNGGIIRNNMIYNDGTGLFHDVGIGLETSPNTQVLNNTVFTNFSNAIEYRFAETNNVVIANNLTNQLIRSRDGGQAALSTNYTAARNSWFKDLSNGNLRLNANYPEVVDAGTNLPNVLMDIDQTPRPQAAFHDIGAHEFSIPSSLKVLDGGAFQVFAFPNPAFNSFRIQGNLDEKVEVIIYNPMLQAIAVFKKVSLSPGLMLDSSNWAPGIYACHVSAPSGTIQWIKVVIFE